MNNSGANENMQMPEDYENIVSGGSGFEAAVIEAATEQAQDIIQKAKEEGKNKYEAMLAQDKADVVAAHKTEIEAALRRKVAGARQNNMKKLLVYRKQLVNGLFAECEETLLQFTKKEEYVQFVLNSIKVHLESVCEQAIIFIKQSDEKIIDEIKKILPLIEIQIDKTIKIGGVKIKCNRILFDETIDRRLKEERNSFLQNCNLHISTVETGLDNE